jgi:hypothetical protein
MAGRGTKSSGIARRLRNCFDEDLHAQHDALLLPLLLLWPHTGAWMSETK